MAIEPFIEKLTEMTDPEAGDFVSAFDNDAPAGDKDRKLDLARLALLAQANTFLAANTFQGDVNIEGALDAELQGVNDSHVFRGAAGQVAPVVDIVGDSRLSGRAFGPSGMSAVVRGHNVTRTSGQAFASFSNTLAAGTGFYKVTVSVRNGGSNQASQQWIAIAWVVWNSNTVGSNVAVISHLFQLNRKIAIHSSSSGAGTFSLKLQDNSDNDVAIGTPNIIEIEALGHSQSHVANIVLYP